MAASKRDALAEALLNAEPAASKSVGRIEQLFGDRPEVLDAIIVLRRDKKFQYSEIARLLSSEGKIVRPDSVKNWLAGKGVT